VKVRQLIEKLSKCDLNADVEIESFDKDIRSELETVEETYYDYPENKWVVLKGYIM